MAYGPWGVFLLSVVDSLGIPLPAAMDVLLIGVAAGSVETRSMPISRRCMAVMGSAGGNMALFLAARHGAALVRKARSRRRTGGGDSASGSTATGC